MNFVIKLFMCAINRSKKNLILFEVVLTQYQIFHNNNRNVLDLQKQEDVYSHHNAKYIQMCSD